MSSTIISASVSTPYIILRGYSSNIRSYRDTNVTEVGKPPWDSNDLPDYSDVNNTIDPTFTCTPGHHHGTSPWDWWNYHSAKYWTIATKGRANWYSSSWHFR